MLWFMNNGAAARTGVDDMAKIDMIAFGFLADAEIKRELEQGGGA